KGTVMRHFPRNPSCDVRPARAGMPRAPAAGTLEARSPGPKTMRTLLLLPLLLAAPALAQTAPPPAANPLLDGIGSAPSAANIERDIRTLVGFGTRHTASDTESTTRGIGAARRWIFDEFTRISKACGG